MTTTLDMDSTETTATATAMPPVVSREEWQAVRDQLLVKEKEATRARDRLNAERRRLPMWEVTKQYTFEGPNGPTSLLDMFEGRRQLIVYHFMFHPDWDDGCPGCTGLANDMGYLPHLHDRDTTLAMVSRAPRAKLVADAESHGWTVPWYSSFGSDFNHDFGVTIDDNEIPGTSVFLRDGERIFQTYFTTARGSELLGATYTWLDLTAYGRQEDWEDSPPGWPQRPTYG
jgi:predicted dithiol-disulfide oxidoreductase (DUF899 family)